LHSYCLQVTIVDTESMHHLWGGPPNKRWNSFFRPDFLLLFPTFFFVCLDTEHPPMSVLLCSLSLNLSLAVLLSYLTLFFCVKVDMTTSVACSPAVLNVVVSFMRTYGGRFGHVSLVGRSAAMDMARLCISLARLKRFRVFPDFAELQKALDEGTWEI